MDSMHSGIPEYMYMWHSLFDIIIIIKTEQEEAKIVFPIKQIDTFNSFLVYEKH